ncbi:MAG: hypothetical protein HY318_12965 [Armatimonadetes bacterium]|nr:hypothetical protein [Armatimonadota bacterium]
MALPIALANDQGTAAQNEGWSGNFARDPGFEEDFVNNHSEPHVLSFKGDWFYNQQDLAPDYWDLKGTWQWNEVTPHGGKKSLMLSEQSAASQEYVGAVTQEGGGAWGGSTIKPIPLTAPERFPQPWRASIWCRGGGTLKLGPVEVRATGTGEWERISVECPADQVFKDGSMTLALIGPGEFDDLHVQERLALVPNLIPNPGFERTDRDGYPVGWSKQRKFDWIGPTYYVWTDWMHFHEQNRGRVGLDSLLFHSGKRSLRFDVYPGDEKFVESDLIALNQDRPYIIEVAAFVCADRIKMIDLRCVDEDGAHLPSYRPVQPEYSQGGTATFGNGTFGWRYIRKFFSMPFNEPVKGIRVRLAARGFNGDTLDDSGTRSYACQVGTVWWDDLRVTERTTDIASLEARGVKVPPVERQVASEVGDTSLDLGERLFGDNQMTFSFTNSGRPGGFKIRLTTTLPDSAPAVTESKSVPITSNSPGTLGVPYRIGKLVGDLKQQGAFRLQLFRGKVLITESSYAFNTWPVVVDCDVSRHYSLPDETPVTTSLNLGVSSAALAQVAKLELELKRPADNVSVGRETITDLRHSLAQTRASLPRSPKESYEFNMPTPAWWVDRTNLLIVKLDLSRLKVWPQNQPSRDTVLEVRGVDGNGKVLFSDRSDAFCRMAAAPRQDSVQSVKIREDGAVFINDKPRYLTGATHQNMRTNHGPEIIGQLGMMGHRLPQGEGGKFEAVAKMWKDQGLYSLQFKPVSGDSGTAAYVDMTSDQKKKLEGFVQAGGMESIVSVNTGGWESSIPDTPAARESHQNLNDWIRQITQRPISWSSSGAYNAWNMSAFPYYDLVHAETEMWGPMDFNVIYTPYLKRARKEPSAWVYLPQLYDNTPYERYRFETYENIIRGSAGVEMIQGIGDPTFNRGLAGELRYLEAPLNSRDPIPEVTFDPPVSHLVRRHNGKTYILATNCGPIIMGRWQWNQETKWSGKASHEGDSINRKWVRPGGLRIHGFRGLPMPELVRPGDKIVQYVWLDPKDTPEWVMVAVRGDGRFSHCGVLGRFDFDVFRQKYGNVLMFSELEHSVWHEISYVLDPPTYDLAVRIMGKEWAADLKRTADAERAKVDRTIYQPEHFRKMGSLPSSGDWYRIEIAAEAIGLAGTLVDGFAYISSNGRALWDFSALERNGKIVRVFCEDTVGIDRSLLGKVRVEVPGLRPGTPIRALFEDRALISDDDGFSDDFVGVDTYGYEAGGVAGDMFGYVKDENRDLPRMIPSGYGYTYGPTQVHIYEIEG